MSSSRELSPQLGHAPPGITDYSGWAGPGSGGCVWQHLSWSVFRLNPALIGGGCLPGWSKLHFLWVFN